MSCLWCPSLEEQPTCEDCGHKISCCRCCSCGSGEQKEALYDGYGIFLTYACSKCEKQKMRGFRPNILDCYETDEPIGAEDY